MPCTQHGLYAIRAIEYVCSAVVILTEHLYFGRALKSYGQAGQLNINSGRRKALHVVRNPIHEISITAPFD